MSTSPSPAWLGDAADGAGDAAPVRVSRQPVFTPTRRTYGHRLLCHDAADDGASGTGGTAATARVIGHVCLTVGLDALSGGQPVFVGATRELLDDDALRLLPPEVAVVELAADAAAEVAADADAVAACRRLREHGFRLAVAADDRAPDDALAPLADVITVDFGTADARRRRDAEALAEQVGAHLLADGVDSPAELATAHRLGADLVAGAFFSRPEELGGSTAPGSHRVSLRLLQELNRDELDYAALAELVKQDVDLSYKLLTYINTARFGLRRRIASVREAMVLLGEDLVRRWGTAAALQRVAGDKPSELLRTCTTRGRMCEALGHELGLRSRGLELFSVGMFSLADAVFDQPLPHLVRRLPLSAEGRATLLGEPTDLAGPLDLVCAYERGDWDEVERTAQRLGRADAPVFELYLTALAWSQDAVAD